MERNFWETQSAWQETSNSRCAFGPGPGPHGALLGLILALSLMTCGLGFPRRHGFCACNSDTVPCCPVACGQVPARRGPTVSALWSWNQHTGAPGFQECALVADYPVPRVVWLRVPVLGAALCPRGPSSGFLPSWALFPMRWWLVQVARAPRLCSDY